MPDFLLPLSYYLQLEGHADKTMRKKVGGWHGDPCRNSLGLLPSGPDPVGEWLVHHQPPAVHIVNLSAKSKQKIKKLLNYH